MPCLFYKILIGKLFLVLPQYSLYQPDYKFGFKVFIDPYIGEMKSPLLTYLCLTISFDHIFRENVFILLFFLTLLKSRILHLWKECIDQNLVFA